MSGRHSEQSERIGVETNSAVGRPIAADRVA
jgi:hypothetical protein